jgi:hypothetical protein
MFVFNIFVSSSTCLKEGPWQLILFINIIFLLGMKWGKKGNIIMLVVMCAVSDLFRRESSDVWSETSYSNTGGLFGYLFSCVSCRAVFL